MWKAIPLVFEDAIVSGCAFQWCQCTWRTIQEIGLSIAYQRDDATYKLCSQYMALPNLPTEKNSVLCLSTPQGRLRHFTALTELTNFIRENWIARVLATNYVQMSFNRQFERTTVWKDATSC